MGLRESLNNKVRQSQGYDLSSIFLYYTGNLIALDNVSYDIKGIQIEWEGILKIGPEIPDRFDSQGKPLTYKKLGSEEGWILSASNITKKLVLFNMQGHSLHQNREGGLKLFNLTLSQNLRISKILIVSEANTLTTLLTPSIIRRETDQFQFQDTHWDNTDYQWKDLKHSNKNKNIIDKSTNFDPSPNFSKIISKKNNSKIKNKFKAMPKQSKGGY